MERRGGKGEEWILGGWMQTGPGGRKLEKEQVEGKQMDAESRDSTVALIAASRQAGLQFPLYPFLSPPMLFSHSSFLLRQEGIEKRV